jgi:hypothetical protein
MRNGKLIGRWTSLVLAVATSACAPRATRAQDAVAPPAPPARPAEPAPPAQPAPPAPGAAPVLAEPRGPTTRSKEERLNSDRMRAAQDAMRAQQDAIRAQQDALRKQNDEFLRAKEFKLNWVGPRIMSPDSPVVISTEPMDATAAAEWKEDLQVMDKVVREELATAGGDDPQAMGIKLTMIGRAASMYVEGAGVIFNASVNFPLAPIGATTGKKDDKPRDPASKWEKAKRDLSGYPMPRRLQPDGKEVEEGPALVFDQAKLDRLVSSLAKAMAEASNIRHLKENEAVFVTIAGIDEGGMPVRLTLKATKADIDAAAGGKLSAEEFAKRVARRIGQIP